MTEAFTILTQRTSFQCQREKVQIIGSNTTKDNSKDIWKCFVKQSNGVEGELRLPGDWALTRIMQYFETLDQTV